MLPRSVRAPAPPRRSLGAAVRLLALLACAATISCGPSLGLVEVYWEFLDGDLDRIYPGTRRDTCEFTSASGIRYDLRVQLTVAEASAECEDAWDQPDCQIVEPRIFPCNRSRGTALDIPASDSGYVMVVETVIDPTDAEPFVPRPSCVLGPGVRVRRVRPGRITDLEVYQFVVQAESPLDIELCAGSDPDSDEPDGGESGEAGGSEGEDSGESG